MCKRRIFVWHKKRFSSCARRRFSSCARRSFSSCIRRGSLLGQEEDLLLAPPEWILAAPERILAPPESAHAVPESTQGCHWANRATAPTLECWATCPVGRLGGLPGWQGRPPQPWNVGLPLSRRYIIRYMAFCKNSLQRPL